MSTTTVPAACGDVVVFGRHQTEQVTDVAVGAGESADL